MRGRALLTLALTVSLLRGTAANAQTAASVPPKGGAANTPAELSAEAMAAYRKKDYALSARLFQAAAERGARDLDTLYNAACALALAGERDAAFRFLDSAIEAGFRSAATLRADADFASLREDPRWAKALLGADAQQARWVKEHSDPLRVRFVTTDIDRFWKAWDRAMKAPAEERVAIFQTDYVDPGTPGLKDWAASGRLKAAALVKTIEARPDFYRAIRPLTTRLSEQFPRTIEAFRKLKSLDQDAVFPDVYFVIGQVNSGGTSAGSGLLMGAEMFARDPAVPKAELSDWERSAIMAPAEIPALVAHESIHFLQEYPQGTLLCAALKEGIADFLGQLTSGELIARMKETHAWANARERDLWTEFQKDMDGKDTSRWLYGTSGGNGRPVDLGYWMGFRIGEAYFKNAPAKDAAVRDMLAIRDCGAFLKASRYAEKFTESRPQAGGADHLDRLEQWRRLEAPKDNPITHEQLRAATLAPASVDRIRAIFEGMIHRGVRIGPKWLTPETGGEAILDTELRLVEARDPRWSMVQELVRVSDDPEAIAALCENRALAVAQVDTHGLLKGAVGRFRLGSPGSASQMQRALLTVAQNAAPTYSLGPDEQLALITSSDWQGRYVGGWHTHAPHDENGAWAGGDVPSFEDMQNAVQFGQYLTLSFQPDGFDLYDAEALGDAKRVDLSLVKVIRYRSPAWDAHFRALRPPAT